MEKEVTLFDCVEMMAKAEMPLLEAIRACERTGACDLEDVEPLLKLL